MNDLILKATLDTLTMVSLSTLIGICFGLPLALLLCLTNPQGLRPKPFLYGAVGSIINAFRSIPYIILIVLIIPLTRLLTGSSIGLWAAIVPLSLASILLITRALEDVFLTVPYALLEAGQSMGASLKQIIFKILIPEALPRIVAATTMVIINLIGFSAMAGAVGGGGLGDLAIRYGYQRYNLTVLMIIVVILILIVQICQSLGDRLSRALTQ